MARAFCLPHIGDFLISLAQKPALLREASCTAILPAADFSISRQTRRRPRTCPRNRYCRRSAALRAHAGWRFSAAHRCRSCRHATRLRRRPAPDRPAVLDHVRDDVNLRKILLIVGLSIWIGSRRIEVSEISAERKQLGSESFCSRKTTTSRVRQASWIRPHRTGLTAWAKSSPRISAPRGACRISRCHRHIAVS